MSLLVYCDNEIEGRWFRKLSSGLHGAELRRIGRRGTNPPIVDDLVEYDRPDIILLRDGSPVLVLEKTREVPTGHNVGQRFARLVRAAEGRVPTLAFFPFDAMKHGEYANVCNLNIRLLKAFESMSRIHATPVLAVNWPVDGHHELLDDGTEDARISEIVNAFVSSGFARDCPEFSRQQIIMRGEHEKRLRAYPEYENPPSSVAIVKTELFVRQLGLKFDHETSVALLKRSESVTYKMVMTPEKCRREDPYTGTQFIYDYLWCRTGPKVTDKNRNLILHFPKILLNTWQHLNPNDKGRKSCNWYLTANALVFSDSILLLRE